MTATTTARPALRFLSADTATGIVAYAVARVVGAQGEPVETLAALEARYFPLFHAMIRTAHSIGRQIRKDEAA